MTVVERISRGDGPKKILALDGGGIRGMISIEILSVIEDILRDAQPQAKRDSFVLADYFDFVAGTSTGAILGACISLGLPVAEIRKLYQTTGAQMFDKAFRLKRFKYKYEDEGLASTLKHVFGVDTTLGSDNLRTLLLMVMRNAATNSPWPIWNNPHAKYNDRGRRDSNLGLPLWQLVRASTAAPDYFPPEVVRVGVQEFIFVDGGVTIYNNPSFQSFLMATTEPYNLNWSTGEDKMLIVSIGTGTNPNANKDLSPDDMNLIYNATSLPSALMFSALNEQDFLCRIFGKCLAGPVLDREVGNLIGKRGPVSPKLFTYTRYNAELTYEGLASIGLGDIRAEDVQKLDSVEQIHTLQRVGQAVAKQVNPIHFAMFA